jgi:hypothetical protein
MRPRNLSELDDPTLPAPHEARHEDRRRVTYCDENSFPTNPIVDDGRLRAYIATARVEITAQLQRFV